MVIVTVIIVTYNSAATIGHCIDSILYSQIGVGLVEIIIVDNNSTDHTLQLLHQYYPECRVLKNRYNYGFGYASNQGAQEAQSQYLLFLNPDIVIDHAAISLLLAHADKASTAEVLGGSLYDGRYGYLKESARKLPTISTALARITGLDRFVKSWSYYDSDQIALEQQVEALTGAFLFIPNKIFVDIEGFDEDFFLYGEDLDLFKRIKDKEIPVLRLDHVKAVHFKGESGFHSWGRNYHFYNALVIYAQKHLGIGRFIGDALSIISLTLALLKTISQRFIGRSFYVLIFGSIYLIISALWSSAYFKSVNYLDWSIVGLVALLLAITYVSVLSLFGYFISERGSKSRVVSSTIAFASVMIFYSFLPESLRFSRLSVLIGSILSVFVSVGLFKLRRHVKHRFKAESSVVFRAQIEEILPSASFVDDNDYDSLAIRISPFYINNLAKHVNRKSQVYYYNERTKSLFNSDLSFRGGQSYEHFSKFNLASFWAKRQRGLLCKLVAGLLSIPLLPLLIFSNRRSNIINNLRDLFSGEISLIGDYLPREEVINRPYIGKGLIPIDQCNLTRNPQALSHDYALHYSILNDIYFGSSNFTTLFKRIQDDIKN